MKVISGGRKARDPRPILAGRGGGAKGGSGGGATAQEDADTLQSRQFARILEVLSEGPIQGWAHPEFPLRDIYFDGTVVQSGDHWGVISDGHVTNGQATLYSPSANFPFVEGKPLKSQLAGRWIRSVDGATIPQSTQIVSVEDAHHLTMSRAATANSSALAYQVGGTINFKGVNFQFRSGTQDQTYMEGFPATEATFGVNVRVSKTAPWSHDFTDPTLDAARVDVRFPRLQKQDTSTGDVHGTTVRLKVKVNGSVAIDDVVKGKASSPYLRTYKVELGGYAGPVKTVTVERTTDDSHEQALQNETWVDSYTEVTYGKLRHPNSAKVGLRVNAKNFGAVPARAYHIKGLLCKVPSNYNPVTRVYTGVWDGTFQTAWTTNPAWCWNDMVVNDRYGLGHLLVQAGVDKWALYTVGKYCDEPVNDGKGGLEPRFACNLYIQRKEDAIKVLQDMAGIFRGMVCYINGAVTPVQDAPTDPSSYRMFSPANVINGQFNYAGTGLRARHNVAVVSWNDLNDVGRIKQEYVEDHDGITRQGGINQLELTGFGCWSRGQARRIGLFAIYAEKILNDTITFQTALEGYFVPPGKLFQVQDPFRAGADLSGRLKPGSTNTHLFLDRPVVLEVGKTYTVAVMNPTTNMLVAVNVTEAGSIIPKTDIAIASLGFTPAPEADSIFQLAANDLVPELFRVLGATLKEKNVIEITGLQYNESLYGFVDFDHPLEEPPISQLPPAGGVLAPAAPLVLQVVQVIRPDHTLRQDLEVAWGASPDPYLWRYIVEWRLESGNWHRNSDVDTTSWTIANAQPGNYEVRVIAVNTINAHSAPLEGEKLVATPPTNVTGVAGLEIFGGNVYLNGRAVFQARDCHFAWRVTSGTGSEHFGDGPLEAGVPDPMADHFNVRILNDDVQIWEDDTISSEYTFTWERNVQAVEDRYGPGFGALRIFTIEVRAVFTDNTLSDPARLIVENPLPPPPRNVTTLQGNGYVAWQWDLPSAPDIDHFALFSSTDPDDDDPPQVAEFHGTSGTFYPQDLLTRYYWLGTVDSFGSVSSNVPQGPPPGGVVLRPRFLPAAGTYQQSRYVQIVEDTPGCSLRYALVPFGTNPSVFTVYPGGLGIFIEGRKALYAIATQNNPPYESSTQQGNYFMDGYQPPSPPPQGAPPNDPFGSAIAISGAFGGPLNGTTIGASVEGGEPSRSPENVDKTVWYNWTGVTTGKLVGFWAHSSSVIIEAWTGTAFINFVFVGKSTSGILFFTQTAGTVYRIRVRPVLSASDFALVWYTPTVSQPEFTANPPGFYELEWPTRTLNVDVATETSDAELYWAFGRNPTRLDYDGHVRRSSQRFVLDAGVTDLRVMAIKDYDFQHGGAGWLDSSVAVGGYTVLQSLGPPCGKPRTVPPAGLFDQFPLNVQLLCDDPPSNAVIRYTTNGLIPSRGGEGTSVLSGATVALPHPCFLKMVAFTRGREESTVYIGRFQLRGRTPAPAFKPSAGSFPSFPLSVDIAVPAQTGLKLRYTLDGSTPTETHGTLINSNAGTVSIPAAGTTLRAVAFGDGYITSSVTTAVYSGKIATPTHSPDTSFYDPGTSFPVTVDVPTGGGFSSPGEVQASNLKLWLEADTLALANGDPVAAWNDASGNANNAAQATAGSKPRFDTNVANGKPGVFFDGVDDFMEIAANAAMQAAHYTIFAVIKTGAAAQGSVLSEDYAWVGTADDDVRYEMGYGFDSGTPDHKIGAGHYVDATVGGIGWVKAADAADDAPGTAYLYCATYDGTTVRLYRSGTLIGTAADAAGFNRGSRQFWLGRRHDNVAIAQPYFKGHILALAVYGVALPDADRGQVESGLNSKYGVGAAIPGSLVINGRYTLDGKQPSRKNGTLITTFPQDVTITGGYRELRTIAFAVDPSSGYADSYVKLSTYDWRRSPAD